MNNTPTTTKQQQLKVPLLRNHPPTTGNIIESEDEDDWTMPFAPNTQTAPEPSTDANTEQSENIDLAQAGVEVVGTPCDLL